MTFEKFLEYNERAKSRVPIQEHKVLKTELFDIPFGGFVLLDTDILGNGKSFPDILRNVVNGEMWISNPEALKDWAGFAKERPDKDERE